MTVKPNIFAKFLEKLSAVHVLRFKIIITIISIVQLETEETLNCTIKYFSGALPDVIYMIVPEQEWASWAADYMVSTCLACAFCLLFFHEGRFIVARRTIFIIATLYSMRSVTLMITQLPPGEDFFNLFLRNLHVKRNQK